MITFHAVFWPVVVALWLIAEFCPNRWSDFPKASKWRNSPRIWR